MKNDNDDQYLVNFDVYNIVEPIFRQWRLLLFLIFISAFFVGLVNVIMPKKYETNALVSSTRQISTVSYGSQIETLTEEELQYAQGNYSNRVNSYVAMVKNPTIAQSVLNELEKEIPEELEKMGDILKIVEGKLIPQSDSIAIEITYSEPILAAIIANTWAEYYVEHVNSIYAGTSNREIISSIDSQVDAYYSKYIKAQSDLERFLKQSKIDELNRKIAILQNVLDSLNEYQSLAIDSILTEMIDIEMKVMNDYFSAASQNHLYMLSEYNQRYEELRRLTSLLDSALNMRNQIQKGGRSAAESNTLALMILKMETFSIYQGISKTESLLEDQINITPNIEIKTDLKSFTPEQMISDLDSLISVLESYKNTLEKELNTLSQNLVATEDEETEMEYISQQIREKGALGTGEEFLKFVGVESLLFVDETDSQLQSRVTELEQRIRDLQSELENAKSRKEELIQDRGLKLQTYLDLKTKAAELEVASNTSNRAVSLAASAPVPADDTVNEVLNVFLAAVFGLVFGVFATYLVEFWWSYKGIEPKPITLKMILSSQEE